MADKSEVIALVDGTAKNYGSLEEFYKAMRKPKTIAQSSLQFGDVITFTYTAKGAPEEGTRLRWAFVLHPNFEGKMHAIELTAIPPRDAVMQLLPRMMENQNPYQFYHSVSGVKEFMKKFNCYRTYIVERMSTPLRYS